MPRNARQPYTMTEAEAVYRDWKMGWVSGVHSAFGAEAGPARSLAYRLGFEQGRLAMGDAVRAFSGVGSDDALMRLAYDFSQKSGVRLPLSSEPGEL